HHDLQISIMPLDAAVPGFDTSYRVKVRNVGTVVESGSISLSYSGTHTTYVSASPSPSSQLAGSVIWDLGALPSLSEADFIVTLHLNSPVETPPLDLGDTLFYTATALNSSEETPADNTVLLSDPVVNALDPNDKTCLEGNTISPDMAGKYLHYLIRFENTGNYPAQIVTVEDMIDTAKFDISTIEPLDGSHAFTTRITGNKVEFIFNNIMLPFDDANNDGWVLFRIKTKPTLVLGDSVSNTAGIYFNFNPPVITNTATTTFATMGVDSHFDSSFRLWPNPTNDVLNMESKRGEAITSVSVYNTLGQELLRAKGSDLRNMNVSGLAAGTYVITVATDKSRSSTQLIKK
ncbi:MAG TPA: T9SS type A sorting domain-containing protein, partial [Flavobacterium sp.]|nr:T9SS type A sorting domain-containing protein [Flavobacterium sp.]